ncbi:ULP_PROTEASE domain-containing protein [Raphanus sativus]|nr:ULP_PROTEASE domain-containing protein [Raphanus sativus]
MEEDGADHRLPSTDLPTTTLIRPSVIYDASDHPNSPEIHHILFHGKEIFEPISPDPPVLSQPNYDSSAGRAAKRLVFPLSPLPFTPETSPNKSGDSRPGFIAHSSAINAFPANATSNPPSVANNIIQNPGVRVTALISCFVFHHCSVFIACFLLQMRQTEESHSDVGELSDVVKLCDGSP